MNNFSHERALLHQTLNIIFTNWCGKYTYTPLSFSSFPIAVCPGLACDTSTRPELTSAWTARPTPNAWVIVDKITPTGPVASHPATYRPVQRVSQFQFSSASLSSKTLSKCWTYMSISPVIPLPTLNFTRCVLCYCNGTCFWFSWPSIALLQRHMGIVKLAKHYILATLYVCGSVDQALQYCNKTCVRSSWPSITLL